MRFPPLPAAAMPASSVREWLDRELETRGIDAVVYTRYILSILQQDTLAFEPQERDLFPPAATKKRDPCPGKAKGPKGKQRVNNAKPKFADSEEMKKSAAVECLLSASEQTCGIEELVDELCSRLKSIQCEGYPKEPDSDAVAVHVDVEGPGQVKESSFVQSSPEELAKKYYAAFPALSGQLHMRDDIASYPSFSMQYNTFWDGKKLLSAGTDGCSQLEDKVEDSEKPISHHKTDVFTVEEAEKSSEPKPAKQHLSKVPHIHYTHHHLHHHHHHHHQHHHHAKMAKLGREQPGGKPSFIVPKCKYRMLKQRVPFFKGKTPFSAPELRLKRFVLSDSKPNSHSKSPGGPYFRSKKFDDFEVGYDSSFEDGDAAEDADKERRKISKEECAEGSCAPTDSNLEEEEGKDHYDGRSGCEQNPNADGTDDVEVLHKLEAKFNEGLASIWSKRDAEDTPIDKLSQMLETALTWFTKLKKSDGEVYLCTPDEMMAAMDYYLDVTADETAILKPGEPEQQILIQKLGGLWERTADPGPFQQGRIWQCGTRKQNFINGGVYGFEERPEQDRDGSESDLFEKAPLFGSPAFDSDAESFVEDSRGSKLELNAIREEELKIIWEILGAIGGSDSEESRNGECGEVPSFQEDARTGEKLAEDSVWEPLERYDLWDRDPTAARSWGYCSDAEQASTLSELSLLWNGNFNVQAKEIRLFGSDGDDVNAASASFCWGGAEPCHRSFWDIWKDDEGNGSGCGVSIIEALVACSGPPAHSEHLSMTRSYDSYLDRGAAEEAPGRAQEQLLHRSDPALFGRKSTLTYHRGESLFVEVKQRRNAPAGLKNAGAVQSRADEPDEASIPDAGEDPYEEENLLTSPKTHFRPIRPLSCDSDAESASSCEAVAKPRDLQAANNAESEGSESTPASDKPIFTQDENGILHLSSEDADGGQLYMLYRGQEGGKHEEAAPAFVPKFKLRPDLEKFCQTEDAAAVHETAGGKLGVTALNGRARELVRKDGIAGLFEISAAFKDLIEEEDDFGFGKCGWAEEPQYSFGDLGKDFGCIVGFRPSELLNGNFEGVSSSLWSAGDDDDSSGGLNGEDSSWPANSGNDPDEQDFWAVSEREEAAGLMAMKDEIKQEEEELFEDINQMRELEWNDGCSPTGGPHNTAGGQECLRWPSPDHLYQEVMLECQEDEDCPELEMINGRQRNLASSWDQDLDGEGCAQDGGEVAEDAASVCLELKSFKVQDALDPDVGKHKLSMIPNGKVVYSSDLEDEWMKHGKAFDIQVPKRHFLKAKLRSQRRPCTFYMDGNCRRTDCKFSHDLASITCRFWEEGSCFKGITCPFLHGYPRKHSPLHASSKAKDFLLESESDFPSLSKSVDSTSSGSWMASAFSVKRKRKRNRPRHHSSSTAESDSAKCKIIESGKA